MKYTEKAIKKFAFEWCAVYKLWTVKASQSNYTHPYFKNVIPISK